ncbi:MAG: Asp-tRNA(Asn)/Glu-tRNA(Gln) amidotransferase subunit GatC [Betaproteobacteria bacterium]|nr:Asp-tRNA(Asn)/Glu-tRNA(Gln) amidotransferase subunit GatC [Betaproteobacteria bacterium]
MSLSLLDIKRIALLARIAVSEQQAHEALNQLNPILGLIEQLQAANTEGVEPMSHAQDVSQRLRPDEATEPDRHGDFQSVAPQVEADLYLVPKVIE